MLGPESLAEPGEHPNAPAPNRAAGYPPETPLQDIPIWDGDRSRQPVIV